MPTSILSKRYFQPLKLAVAFALLLLCCFSSALAQDKFYEAGYILQNRDTIRGFIKRTDEASLSSSIEFKANLASDSIHQYTPLKLKGFGFDEARLHFSAVEVGIRTPSLTITEPRFAKNLLKGDVSLYKLQLTGLEKSKISLKSYSHVYVLEKEGEFYTLGQYEINIDNYVGVDKKYIGMLRAALSDCLNKPGAISNELPYTDAALIKLLEQYNQCKNPAEKSTVYHYTVKTFLKHGIEAGANRVFVSGEEMLSKNYGYSAGYFWDITKPEFSRRFSEKVGINYLYLHYNLEQPRGKEDLPVEMHILRVPLLTQLNFNNFPDAQITPFIHLGITGQISSHSQQNYLDIIPFLTVGGGVYFQRIMVNFSIDNVGFSFKKNKILQLGIGYRFDKR